MKPTGWRLAPAWLRIMFMMRHKFFPPAIVLAVTLACSVHASEVEQLKSDLTGQTMGGREKCWKFQSPKHIKGLIIERKTEDAQKRVYILKLQLEADKVCGKYAAEARVEYVKAAAGWKIKHVGLLSLAKVH